MESQYVPVNTLHVFPAKFVILELQPEPEEHVNVVVLDIALFLCLLHVLMQ